MRSVRPGVRESRGCAVLAVLASDQRGALGASLLAPKAPRSSSGPEDLLLSARGLSRRDRKQEAPPPGNQWQAPRPLSVPPGAAEPNDSPRQSPSHARGPKPPRRARRARGCKRPLGKTVLSKALLQPPPRHASAGSELYHRVCNEPFDAVMVSVVVPALGMRDVHLRARLKIWEPFLDSPDQHGLR